MKQLYQITEYGSFLSGKEREGYVTLPEETFAGLESFLLSCRNTDDSPLDLMGISVKKGVGRVITAKNYVGVITMKDGTSIEILPKICSPRGCDAAQAKRILMEMLKTLKSVPCRSFQTSHVDLERMNILEIFIRMLIDEVFAVVKRGLKCGYHRVEVNGPVFRGKLMVSAHIRHNCVHRERFYAAVDEFDPNRPENRLIKSTLLCLYRQTTSARNKRDLRTLLNVMDEVPPSVHYDGDFSRAASGRGMAGYQTVLSWCRVFLRGKSFTSFYGSETAQALLFPMETLFESYIAALMRRKLPSRDFHVSAQDRTYHLFNYPYKRFQMKPDIVVTRRKDGAVFLCDTKWKLLSGARDNYGISQADMYQMYAYQKKYHAQFVSLLYPMSAGLAGRTVPEFDSGDGVRVRVRQIDLLEASESLERITADFRGGLSG